MRYPAFLKKGDTIGLVAPSFGVNGYPYFERYQKAKETFISLGYKIKECPSIYNLKHAASNTPINRAKEFMDMYLDDEVDMVFSVAGGELMIEILPFIDFDYLKKAKPKFFQGYSDNTNLTFTLNTICDVCSIYGANFGSFGMNDWDQSLRESLEILSGNRNGQSSYQRYEIEDKTHLPDHALDSYNLTELVKIESLNNQDCSFTGRIVGGCLDILDLISGSPFDYMKEFSERYQHDGIILFFESCDLTVLDQYRSYWRLKQNGWLKNVKGIIVGRAVNSDSAFDIDFKEALRANFEELNIPVVYGCDIGHVPPSWSIVCGSIATVEKISNNLFIHYDYK